MSGLKQLFHKKAKKKPVAAGAAPSEGYVAMDCTSLIDMPISDLINIIYRYDAEVKFLNSQLEDACAKLACATDQIDSLGDELVSVRELRSLESPRGKLRPARNRKNRLSLWQGAASSAWALSRPVEPDCARCRPLMERLSGLEQDKQNSGIELFKKRIETETAQKQVARLQFTKDSQDAELRRLKETALKNNDQIENLCAELASLNALLKASEDETGLCRGAIEQQKTAHDRELLALRKEFELSQNSRHRDFSLQIKEFHSQIKDLEKNLQRSANAQSQSDNSSELECLRRAQAELQAQNERLAGKLRQCALREASAKRELS